MGNENREFWDVVLAGISGFGCIGYGLANLVNASVSENDYEKTVGISLMAVGIPLAGYLLYKTYRQFVNLDRAVENLNGAAKSAEKQNAEIMGVIKSASETEKAAKGKLAYAKYQLAVAGLALEDAEQSLEGKCRIECENRFKNLN